MKIYIDIPNSFIVPAYLDHADVRSAYKNIIAAAADLRLSVVLLQANSPSDAEGRPEDGLHYAYHRYALKPNCYCVKASALPGRWYFDKSGYSGWSSLALDPTLQEQSADYDLRQADEAIASFRNRFLENNLSRLRQPDEALEELIACLDEFLFYPLQVNSDEVLKLGRYAQFEIVSRLAALALEHKRHVILKRHPLCTSSVVDRILADFRDHPYVHVSNASVHQLIAACRCVLVSNSGVGVEALIHGKPVFSLAASEYAHITIRLPTLDELASALLSEPIQQSERQRRQLGYLIDSFWVDVTREDRIADRIREHIASFDAAVHQPSAATRSAAGELSVLSRANKELVDIVDLLLASYPTLTGEQREKIAPILARAANHGVNAERIFRNADARVWRRSMNHFRVRGDLGTAELLARQVLEEWPEDSEAQLLLSRVLAAKGLHEQSFAAAKAAVDCPEPVAGALTYFGRRLLARSKTNGSAALSCAERALALNPQMAEAHYLKAKALLIDHEPERAFESATAAVRLAPAHSLYRALYDAIAGKMKQLPEARATSQAS